MLVLLSLGQVQVMAQVFDLVHVVPPSTLGSIQRTIISPLASIYSLGELLAACFST